MADKPVVVVGAGPAGLCAAIELKKAGAPVVLLDENDKPGGQLFKQIHKFFGSREHKAGTRGFDIGTGLLDESLRLGIDVRLKTEVVGVDPGLRVWAVEDRGRSYLLEASRLVIATGATENALSFPGWTLPGVMTAGCAQTLVNVYRVLPGKRVLIIGSGNVGVIVGYQLMQAGAEVVGVVEAAPTLGGYGVHTAKLARAGVPFHVRTTVARAEGGESLERATIVGLDDSFKPLPGTERTLEVDTICLAVGLTPSVELPSLAGCATTYVPELGGRMPLHDEYMRSSVEEVYVVGDTAGVEEASTAMEEGRLAGIHAAWSLGYLDDAAMEAGAAETRRRLDALRQGVFGKKRFDAKSRVLEESHNR
ncbi:MAG: NAD(P)/FAD-dependent oxidoreductase [Spirochaetes bacterium]|nr:NAD(P)/FAD-dependent oxidoreductase [Spirochaetota bacterium]MBU1080593.1 NAD(P)/FAD-dependent oxidoreductase [Spirochaetota bacterium]